MISRKPRADGQRNRERLIEAAKAAFAEVGADVSLDAKESRRGSLKQTQASEKIHGRNIWSDVHDGRSA